MKWIKVLQNVYKKVKVIESAQTILSCKLKAQKKPIQFQVIRIYWYEWYRERPGPSGWTIHLLQTWYVCPSVQICTRSCLLTHNPKHTLTTSGTLVNQHSLVIFCTHHHLCTLCTSPIQISNSSSIEKVISAKVKGKRKSTKGQTGSKATKHCSKEITG